MPTKTAKPTKSTSSSGKKPAVKDLTPKKNPKGGHRDYPNR